MWQYHQRWSAHFGLVAKGTSQPSFPDLLHAPLPRAQKIEFISFFPSKPHIFVILLWVVQQSQTNPCFDSPSWERPSTVKNKRESVQASQWKTTIWYELSITEQQSITSLMWTNDEKIQISEIAKKIAQLWFEGNCYVGSSKRKTNTRRMSTVKTLWTSLKVSDHHHHHE